MTVHKAFRLLVLCIALAGAAFAGCGSESRGEEHSSAASTTESHTLIFVDQSASAETGAETRELFADSIEQIVRERLDNSGDQLSLFPVHEKTTSKVGRVDKVNDVRLPQPKEFEADQGQEEIRYKREALIFVDSAAADLKSRYNSATVDSEFGRWTDLWGTIGVASEELASDSSRKKIYYFSDMFESMSGEDRRNFDRQPPTSRKQAEAWAEEDVQKLTEFISVDANVLQDVEVRVLQGRLATKENAQFVKFYWLKLFEELGVDKVHYN